MSGTADIPSPADRLAEPLARALDAARRRDMAVLATLACLLVAAAAAGAGLGAVEVTPGQMLAILAAPLGLELPWEYGAREEAVFLAIRLPRACLAILTGAALALAGAAMQGLFRNPLADPGLIGVSNGAALAAVVTIVLGGGLVAVLPEALLAFALPLAAFLGGLGATFIVYRVSQSEDGTDVPTMLLAGVAINAIAAAGIGLMVFLSTDQQLRDLSFWLLGSLGGVTWERLMPVAPLIFAAAALLPRYARHLNALLLGEDEAVHLGADVERTKRVVVVLAALATSASVALTGVIGFVGLVVPHLIRLLAGPDHRLLLPASAMLGAALLLLADLLARTVALPAELPIGVVTACVGGPFFLWLLMRRRRLGGW